MKTSFTLSLVSILFLASCARGTLDQGSDLKIAVPANNEIVVMSYNVENLFDTEHDEGKADWTFLPANHPLKNEECDKIKSSYRRRECFETNWTEAHLELKLTQIERVIKSFYAEVPDVLALTEVENHNVAGMLANKLGYEHFVVSNGQDERGIDVALLWREGQKLKKVREIEHHLKDQTTRPILEVEFILGGKVPLFIFVNHWPSLSNPNEARIAAAKLLKSRIAKLQSKVARASFVALGDFNSIETLNPHPFHDVLTKGGGLVDLGEEYFNSLAYDQKTQSPPGTYFYQREMQWNRLDRIFVSRNLTQGHVKSFRILSAPFLTSSAVYDRERDYLFGSSVKGVPWGYDHLALDADKAGFSDHFALDFKVQF